MAERRMFSKKIIDSARFIKMPTSSQALYFHMGVRADDDGIVEGYNVMRMIGATEDDLKVLVAKGFVTILNEDLVAYINDWKEHNLIRADRKVDSIYKDLLLQIVPEVQLLEPKQRSDVKNKQVNTPNGRPVDNQWTASGQPMDVQMQSIDGEMSAQDRLGKDRLGKDRLGKDRRESIDYQRIVDMYNDTCVSFPRLKILSDNRKKAIKARFNSGYTYDDFKKLFEKAEQSTFLKGSNKNNWSATFDWLIKDSNMAKVLDGNYDNKSSFQSQYSFETTKIGDIEF